MCAQSITVYKGKAIGTLRPSHYYDIKAKGSIISSYFLKVKFTNGNGNKNPYRLVSITNLMHNSFIL